MMTPTEWDNLVNAYQKIQQGLFKGVEKPSLDDFVEEHAAAMKEENHSWLVHTHGADKGHWGLMFLAWHRVFLNEFENRLRKEVPGVTIPYWNAYKDPFPEELKKISDNEGERLNLSTSLLPNFDESDYETFQHDLEVNYHNWVHAGLGQTVANPMKAPRDAAFWLHHAFIDRQWGHWFQKHNGALPPSMEKQILGDEIVRGKKVKDVLHTTQLDYVYDNGVYSNVERKGSANFCIDLQKDMILCAKLNDDFHVKMSVYNVTNTAAFLTLQTFPFGKPGPKVGMFPPHTAYCDLILGKFDVPRERAHVRVLKETVGSSIIYKMETVNGTKLAQYTGITNFAANNGVGVTDYNMLYI